MLQRLKQLETDVRALPKALEEKLASVRRTAWDGRGNYRGILDSEDEARGFGLYVMAHVGHDIAAR